MIQISPKYWPAGKSFAVLLLSASLTFAQQESSQLQGSVPQGSATATPVPLSLAGAIEHGLHANLSLLTSEESSVEVRTQRVRALSALLPNVTGQVGETVQ